VYYLWLSSIEAELRTKQPDHKRFLFINAWNEWGEGCHLEPDEKFGYAWLNATKAVLSQPQIDQNAPEGASFGLNPSIREENLNKLKALTGNDQPIGKVDFLAEYTALLSIFRDNGHAFQTSKGLAVRGADGESFTLEKRSDLEHVTKKIWSDVEAVPFCFVLLQYNKWEHTLKCVESIRKLSVGKRQPHIVIVDNASSDEVVAKTRELFGRDQDVSLVLNSENLGFAGGNNVGYRLAKEQLGDAFIVVMNNDVVICDPDFLAKCRQLFRHWSYSVLGPDILTSDGRRENPWNDYVYGLDGWEDLRELFLRQKEAYLKTGLAAFQRIGERSPHNSFVANPILQGACYIFSPIFVRCHEQPFDEVSLLYGEEFPLAINCLTTGHFMLYSSELGVVHEEGVSTGLVPDRKKMLHGYDGALAGIRLATQRLQRQLDAVAGRPLVIEENGIKKFTSDGRKHVLIDLFFCQPGFHGGGEYGKAVFQGLVKYAACRPDVQIWVALDPDLFIDKWVWDECRRFAVNILRVKSYEDIVKLVNMSCFYSFFAPAIVVYTGYEYMKKVGGNLRFDELIKTRVVGTLHDLRDFELASQWEIIATARRKAGCMPELGLTSKEWEAEKARQDKMGQDLALMYQRLCHHKALKTLVTVSFHSAQSIRKNAQCSQPIQVLFAPEKNREKPEPFIWRGINFQNDPYLILLNAGRFEKNAAGAVAAFNKLCGQPEFTNKHPDLKLVLVGINNLSDMGIKNPNLHHRIVVLPHLSPAQLEYLLMNSCGLLYPSFNEGFGLPPVEAMSIGVPCVVSKCTSLPEVCGDAVSYCDPLDVDSIAAAIKSLLAHRPNIQKLKAQAAAVKLRQNKDLAVLSSLILGLSKELKRAESPTNESDCNTKNLPPGIVCG
jgi:GT2 family glycosyltransferase